MRKRYKSIDEMISKLGNKIIKQAWVFSHARKNDNFPIYCYQDICRIYLDEYSEQEKIDEVDNYFENRWLRRH